MYGRGTHAVDISYLSSLFLSRVTRNTCQGEIRERLNSDNIHIIKTDTLFF